jgi:hypothetical protein
MSRDVDVVLSTLDQYEQESQGNVELFPALRPRLLHRSFAGRQLLSAVDAAKWWIFVFLAYVMGVTLILQHTSLAKKLPELFGKDAEYTALDGVLYFGIFFVLLAARVFSSQTKYSVGITSYIKVLDTTATSSTYLTTFTRLNRATVLTDFMLVNNQRLQLTNALQTLRELQFLLHALPFVVKHNFRSRRRPVQAYDLGVGLRFDMFRGNVDVRQLPLPLSLAEELTKTFPDDALGGLVNSVSQRVYALLRAKALPPTAVYTLSVWISQVTEQKSTLLALPTLGIAPIYDRLLLLLFIVSLLLLPAELWPHFRSWTPFIHLIASTALFTLYEASRLFGNPFDRLDDSPFSYYDTGAVARSTSREVDHAFEKLFARLRVAYENENVLQLLTSGEEEHTNGNLPQPNPEGLSTGGGESPRRG